MCVFIVTVREFTRSRRDYEIPLTLAAIAVFVAQIVNDIMQ